MQETPMTRMTCIPNDAGELCSNEREKELLKLARDIVEHNNSIKNGVIAISAHCNTPNELAMGCAIVSLMAIEKISPLAAMMLAASNLLK